MHAKIKGKAINGSLQNLDSILQKRKGGSINFKGIHYQIIYAGYLILQNLQNGVLDKSIRLEGIEDIDLLTAKIISEGNEYIQLKSSVNRMDASNFWELGVLQNFIDVYRVDPNCKFRLVYNMKIANGNLSTLINRNKKENINSFWISKFAQLGVQLDFQDFLDKVSFEYQSSSELYEKMTNLLFKNWNVNKGSESQFLRSLFYKILVWSEHRATISSTDISILFQEIRDSFSKAPINEAIKNNWIDKVLYNITKTDTESYYYGKAARPIDIYQNLPARRRDWEKKIQEELNKSDITAIISSSGQGKSTLAWQVGYNLLDSYNLYELHVCKNVEEANAIVEFIESRVYIGEIPLIVIDGLNSSVSAWSIIVERTRHLTVKYMLTTRQEDWFRYGSDISRISIGMVELTLTMQEAKEIYEQFKRKDKVSNEIKEWQPVWEQVHGKELLIEYTYLLTQGQMLEDRLSSQLKFLSETKCASSKLEILRLLSLADCMDIKLKSSNLLNHVKSKIGFVQDRDAILGELEKEYFLNFDGYYITGLHPVRSQHLKNLLHKNISIGESLINIFNIIDDDYKGLFFTRFPIILNSNNKEQFYADLARVLSNGRFSDMVYALDGIMYGEPEKYWKTNKAIFDKAYKTGGLELFSVATAPFTKLNTLENLTSIMGDEFSGMKQLSELKKELPIYTFHETDVTQFAIALKKALKYRSSKIDSYEGLEFLMKWMQKLKISFDLPNIIERGLQIDDLMKMDIQEAKELVLYFQIMDPFNYKTFVQLNKEKLISYLKFNTQSLTIQEIDEDICINYLLLDNEVKKANEFSMFRIQVVHAFLPYHKKYCTEAILLPFPSAEIISAVKQDSIKRLTSEDLGNIFESHLNQIWHSVITRKYQQTSAYSWQKQNLTDRQIALEWSKSVVRLIDSLLEGNLSKKEQSVESVSKLSGVLSIAISEKKPYPRYTHNYYEKDEIFFDEKEIDKWFMSLKNVLNQYMNFFIPEMQHKRNVAMINLKSVYFNLSKMHSAFNSVERKTIAYFDSTSIVEEEYKWYKRLYITMCYYFSQVPLENKKAIRVARKVIEDWWQSAKDEKLLCLNDLLKIINKTNGYIFHHPTHLEETETLTHITFGINEFDFSNVYALWDLSIALAPLGNINCDFYKILSIKNNEVVGGLRFKKEYFQAFGKIVSGEENIALDGLTPMPIIIDTDTISMLANVKLPEQTSLNQEKKLLLQIIFDIWKLSEFRSRLNSNVEIERQWLQSVESELKYDIEKNVGNLTIQNFSNSMFMDFVQSATNYDRILPVEDIMDELSKVLATR